MTELSLTARLEKSPNRCDIDTALGLRASTAFLHQRRAVFFVALPRSPKTGARLPAATLIANHALRNAIEDLLKTRPKLVRLG